MSHELPKGVKYLYYAVAPKGTGEVTWVTAFAKIDHMKCSLPSGKEGVLDGNSFTFTPLSEAEYETYIALGSMSPRDSDDFAIWGNTDELMRMYVYQQTAFETGELNDVFDQSE